MELLDTTIDGRKGADLLTLNLEFPALESTQIRQGLLDSIAERIASLEASSDLLQARERLESALASTRSDAAESAATLGDLRQQRRQILEQGGDVGKVEKVIEKQTVIDRNVAERLADLESIISDGARGAATERLKIVGEVADELRADISSAIRETEQAICQQCGPVLEALLRASQVDKLIVQDQDRRSRILKELLRNLPPSAAAEPEPQGSSAA